MTGRPIIPALLALALAGCESRPAPDQLVPIDRVPAGLMDVARKTLPGVTFDVAYKMKVDGQDAYEIKGKTKEGKTREVEVSAAGEVIEIE